MAIDNVFLYPWKRNKFCVKIKIAIVYLFVDIDLDSLT